VSLPLPDPRTLEGRLRARALAFPEATEDFPWGERAIKVRGKTFLFLRAEGKVVSFSAKLPHSAAEALELPFTEPTGYGLGRSGWVTAKVDAGRDAPVATFEAWLAESYRAVAPKRLAAALRAAQNAQNAALDAARARGR
jgi:predicted DNA-binding protein (MmcQ/YjbR family)